MNKLITLCGIVGIAVVACAEANLAVPEGSSSQKKLTTLERRAKLDAIVSQRAGGFVEQPGSGKGSITYVNCQTKVPKSWIEESMSYFTEVTKFKITYSEGDFDIRSPKIEDNVSLFVIDDDTMPPILVAPENRWAFVNVAPIAKENRPAFFEARTKKELSRAFAYLCGATGSKFERSLTRGISSQSELDKNPDYELPMDIVQRFWDYMKPLGVQPVHRATYLKACQDGWAAKPTNDVQKAIWEKVHAEKERGPVNGLKIAP